MSSTYKGYRFRERSSPTPCGCITGSPSHSERSSYMAARGIAVSYETIRAWCARFGPESARRLRRHQLQAEDKWHLDEVFVKIGGVRK